MSVKTLLVEDNPTIRAHLVPTMRDLADVEVIDVVETESDATYWLASHGGDLHLVVVDLLLKQGSGLGVLRHFRKERPSLALVVLSNYAPAIMRERSMSAGATAVFDKSTELEEFLAFCVSLRPQ
ncbi:response regulator [Variovorax paradoxus]|nr:response regulator [Variovorax paradoxus]